MGRTKDKDIEMFDRIFEQMFAVAAISSEWYTYLLIYLCIELFNYVIHVIYVIIVFIYVNYVIYAIVYLYICSFK